MLTGLFPGVTMAEKKGSGRVEKPEGYFTDLFQLFSGKEREEELDEELFSFLAMAWEFGENKGRGSKAPHERK